MFSRPTIPTPLSEILVITNVLGAWLKSPHVMPVQLHGGMSEFQELRAVELPLMVDFHRRRVAA